MILTTKYRGRTNTQGSCVLVYHGAATRPKRIAWDCALDANENHQSAAARVACRLRGLHSGPGSIAAEIASHKSYELPDACNHSRVHIIEFRTEYY